MIMETFRLELVSLSCSGILFLLSLSANSSVSLTARKALEQFPTGVQVILDNTTARDNVKRFAESKNYKVAVKSDGEDFVLAITK